MPDAKVTCSEVKSDGKILNDQEQEQVNRVKNIVHFACRCNKCAWLTIPPSFRNFKDWIDVSSQQNAVTIVFARVVTILGWLYLSGFIGYVIGSFPTAFLAVRWTKKAEIRKAGSGNVGVYNTYAVTGSRLIAFSVLILDVAKGALAVMFTDTFIGQGFVYLAAAALGAVLGHNFPVWLKFKGGRGLATAAGAALVLSWQLIVFWVVFWSAGFIMSRRVNIANTIASALSLIGVLLLPGDFLRQIIIAEAQVPHYKYFCTILFGLILIKHIEPVQEYVNEIKNTKRLPEGSRDARA